MTVINFNIENKNNDQMKKEILQKMKKVNQSFVNDQNYDNLFYDIVSNASNKKNLKLVIDKVGGYQIQGLSKNQSGGGEGIFSSFIGTILSKPSGTDTNQDGEPEPVIPAIEPEPEPVIPAIEPEPEPEPDKTGSWNPFTIFNKRSGGSKSDSDSESDGVFSSDDESVDFTRYQTNIFDVNDDDELMQHIKNMRSKKYLNSLVKNELLQIAKNNQLKVSKKNNYLSKVELVKSIKKFYS